MLCSMCARPYLGADPLSLTDRTLVPNRGSTALKFLYPRLKAMRLSDQVLESTQRREIGGCSLSRALRRTWS